MKQSTIILLTSLLMLACAEEDFITKKDTGNTPYITFMTNVTEMMLFQQVRDGLFTN